MLFKTKSSKKLDTEFKDVDIQVRFLSNNAEIMKQICIKTESNLMDNDWLQSSVAKLTKAMS